MITLNSAKSFGLEKEIGSIEPNKNADLLVIKNKKGKDPIDQLIHSEIEDVEIVFKDGIPLFGKIEHQKDLQITKTC